MSCADCVCPTRLTVPHVHVHVCAGVPAVFHGILAAPVLGFRCDELLKWVLATPVQVRGGGGGGRSVLVGFLPRGFLSTRTSVALWGGLGWVYTLSISPSICIDKRLPNATGATTITEQPGSEACLQEGGRLQVAPAAGMGLHGWITQSVTAAVVKALCVTSVCPAAPLCPAAVLDWLALPQGCLEGAASWCCQHECVGSAGH